MKNNNNRYILAISFFLLAFINIHFALLAFICMTVPLLVLFKTKKKTYCQRYCPRSHLLDKTKYIKISNAKKMPYFFLFGNMKWYVLAYMIIILLISILSTIFVLFNLIDPKTTVQLFFIPIGKMPQVINVPSLDWLIHLSYRLYSMMLTSMTFGLILAFTYKPRTWCVICPISTISSSYIKIQNKT